MRPLSLNDFFGQDDIKKSLSVYIDSAKQRSASLDHTLFFGPPGLGKTSLAMIIGSEFGVKTKVISAPTIEKIGDLVAILTSLEFGDILFIDEIHRLPIFLEETLYSAMEDFKVDIIIASGNEKSVITLELEPFTLIGATTKTSLLSQPLKDRFGIKFELQPYSVDELSMIIKKSANNDGFDIIDSASRIIASASRFTPRVALNIYSRVRDHAVVNGVQTIDDELAYIALDALALDDKGLSDIDQKYLSILKEKYPQPVGIKTLAALLDRDEKSVEDEIEPHLLKLGLIQKTTSGRILNLKEK